MTSTRRSRGGNRSRLAPAALALLVLLPAAPLVAQQPTGLPPIDAMPGPVLGLELANDLAFHSRPEPVIRESLRVSPAMAFRAELRDEAIEYRYTNPWASADEELRGDRPVREGRARAAERMLGDAAGAALEVLLRDALNRPRRPAREGVRRGVRHQLRVDSSPSWRLSGRAGLTSVRLDLPLSAHDELALRCTRRVDGDRCERELSASIRIDPWDETVKFGFEIEF